MEFSFYVDEKVTTWKRTQFNVEADSLEEAKEKAKTFVVVEENHDELPWDNIDDIIEEKMTVEENGGYSTVELFHSDGEKIYENGQA